MTFKKLCRFLKEKNDFYLKDIILKRELSAIQEMNSKCHLRLLKTSQKTIIWKYRKIEAQWEIRQKQKICINLLIVFRISLESCILSNSYLSLP